MKRTFIAFAFIIIIFSLFCAARKKFRLQLDFEEGDSYQLQMISELVNTQEILGQLQILNFKLGMGGTFDIITVKPDGSASVEYAYRSILYSMEGPFGTIMYDSSVPSDSTDPLGAMFSAMIGQRISMTISPDGRTSEVHGFDEMLGKAFAALRPTEEDTIWRTMEKALRDQFGEQAFLENIYDLVNIYPSYPVRVGEAWSRKHVVYKGAPMIKHSTYRFADQRNGINVLEVRSTIETNPDAEPLDMGIMKLHHNISGEEHGMIELDAATGWTVRSSLFYSTHDTLTIEGPYELSYPSHTEGTLTFEQIPK